MPGKNLWPEVYGAWSEISRHLPGPVPQFIPACYQNDPPKSWTPRPILHSLTLRTAAVRHRQGTCDTTRRGLAERPGRTDTQMTDIQLLDEQEVSRRLSVSVNTLRYWRASGDGPNYVKLGRLVRYDAVALEKFIL